MNPRKLPSSGRRARLGGALLASLLLAAPLAYAQSTASVSGRVLNVGTGQYLRNAQIDVQGTAISVTAEDGGAFRIPDLAPGTYKLLVRYTGLEPQEIEVTVRGGEALTRDVSLSSKDDQEIIQLGAVRVASAREGNAKAIMEQKFAPNPVKVIASDSMGNVSEGNVGEFLKLMPGVVMDYVEADTRSMRVRGMAPKYATILLDGNQVASAGSANIGTGRAFEFEQLSISSIETVEMTKAPTPDQPSSVAGTVNLRTKGAFDRKGRYFNYSAGLAWNSYYKGFNASQGWDNNEHAKMLPNFSFDFSDVYMDGRLGIMAGFSRSLTMAAQKHVWNTYNNSDTDLSNDGTEVLGINRIWLQDGPKPSSRANYNVRVDYKITPELRAYVRVDFNPYAARFFNRTLSLRPATYDLTNYTKTYQKVTSGSIDLDTNQFRRKSGQTTAFTSGLSYAHDNFTADLSLHHSVAKSWYASTDIGTFSDAAARLSNVSWIMTKPSAGSQEMTITQTGGADWTNANNYSWLANSIADVSRWSKDQQYTAKLDMSQKLSNTQKLRFGGASNLKVWDIHRYDPLQWSFTGNDKVLGTADDPKVADFLDNTFSPYWGVGGSMNGFKVLSPWKIYEAFRTSPSWFAENFTNNLSRRLRDNWNFKESINSAYLSDEIKFGKLTLSPGVRYELTDSQGKGAVVRSDTQASAISGAPVNSYAWMLAKYGARMTGGNKYGNALWYLHSNYKLTENLVFRGSVHTAITRADPANLIPGISSIDENNKRLTASNPDLSPEKSVNVNLGVEYYFEPVGVLSVNVFSSTIKGLQYTGNPYTLGSEGFEGDSSYAGWLITQPFNITKTLQRSGIELDYSQQLSFLPGVLKGLGVFANGSYTKYDEWAFYSTAKQTANAGVSYRLGRLSTRLNANYVGKSIWNAAKAYNQFTDTWTSAAPYTPEYQRARLQLDLNLEIKLHRNVTFFIDGRNILNEPSVFSYRGSEENYIRVLRTGSIWMAGIKGSF